MKMKKAENEPNPSQNLNEQHKNVKRANVRKKIEPQNFDTYFWIFIDIFIPPTRG
jgi:hypothetical protein